MQGTGMGSGGGPVVLTLAELALFWAATVVHLLRLLAPARLPDTDRAADAGHAVMGAGMTLMVFPGISAGTLDAAAACFGALSVFYIARVVFRLDVKQHRCQTAAIGAGQAAMAYMLAAPTHPPSWIPLSVAGVLAACALVHGRRLIDAQHRHGGAPGAPRMLVTVPHLGALVMTLAMAAMVGSG
jgi:hypothetical protein